MNNDLIKNSRPFIIAEMSGNHNQSLDRAFEIVDAAASAGAHAIKLQTYKAETMTLDIKEGEFSINDTQSIWSGQSMFELYKKAYTPWEWHAPIMERAKKKGLICFSSAFDESAIDFLETLNVPMYKIASFECVDLPLIKKAASTGKPLIISTGMATIDEIGEAVDTARSSGCKNLILLKCTSNYPAKPENSHVRTIPHMRDLFKCEVGLSDHTIGIGAAVAAVAMGATIIEKHVTLSKKFKGPDHQASLEISEFKDFVNMIREAEILCNNKPNKISLSEINVKNVSRKSIVSANFIPKGKKIQSDDLCFKRPGYGVSPLDKKKILGKRSSKNIEVDKIILIKNLY